MSPSSDSARAFAELVRFSICEDDDDSVRSRIAANGIGPEDSSASSRAMCVDASSATAPVSGCSCTDAAHIEGTMLATYGSAARRRALRGVALSSAPVEPRGFQSSRSNVTAGHDGVPIWLPTGWSDSSSDATNLSYRRITEYPMIRNTLAASREVSRGPFVTGPTTRQVRQSR